MWTSFHIVRAPAFAKTTITAMQLTQSVSTLFLARTVHPDVTVVRLEPMIVHTLQWDWV